MPTPKPSEQTEKDRLVDEFHQRPIGHHSPALQRLLTRLRGEPLEDKYVLICRKPHTEWVLGQLSGRRGGLVKILKDQVFTSLDEAEREVFRRRRERHLGDAVK